MTTNRMAAPAGMTGLWVAPWAPSEVYAVAANWSRAESPVMTMDADGRWIPNGRQVGDFSHNKRTALRAELKQVLAQLRTSYAEADDDDSIDDYLADAEDLLTADVAEMADMLDAAGDRYAGNNAVDTAADWIEHGFDANSAGEWVDIGVWDAATAAEFRDAGKTPAEIEAAANALVEDMDSEEAAEAYTDGCPIYAACNSDISADVLIDGFTLGVEEEAA